MEIHHRIERIKKSFESGQPIFLRRRKCTFTAMKQYLWINGQHSRFQYRSSTIPSEKVGNPVLKCNHDQSSSWNPDSTLVSTDRTRSVESSILELQLPQNSKPLESVSFQLFDSHENTSNSKSIVQETDFGNGIQQNEITLQQDPTNLSDNEYVLEIMHSEKCKVDDSMMILDPNPTAESLPHSQSVPEKATEPTLRNSILDNDTASLSTSSEQEILDDQDGSRKIAENAPMIGYSAAIMNQNEPSILIENRDIEGNPQNGDEPPKCNQFNIQSQSKLHNDVKSDTINTAPIQEEISPPSLLFDSKNEDLFSMSEFESFLEQDLQI